MVLEEYRTVVGTIASVVTIGQMFSPAFICKDIIKYESTNDIDVMPFVGGIVMGILMLQNGILIEDPATMIVSISGLILSFIYLIVYYRYTESNSKGQLHMTFLKAGLFLAVIIAYVNQESKELIEFRFGMLITVLLILLVGAPLLGWEKIIQTKDSSSIPIPLVISGTVGATCWLLYGLILENIIMVAQNVICLALNIIQIVLYVMYPPKKHSLKSNKETKTKNDKKKE